MAGALEGRTVQFVDLSRAWKSAVNIPNIPNAVLFTNPAKVTSAAALRDANEPGRVAR